MHHRGGRIVFIGLSVLALASRATAQPAGRIAGRVTDETGGALPGVTVELRAASGSPLETLTSVDGDYAFENVQSGTYQLSFTLINFASLTRRDIRVDGRTVRIDAVLHLSLNAEVTVTGKRTFANLADVENPAENLVGVAQSASQGAITATYGQSCGRARCSRPCRASSSRNTAARAKRTSTSCEGSTSITAAISR
jgi:hypothetical protein